MPPFRGIVDIHAGRSARVPDGPSDLEDPPLFGALQAFTLVASGGTEPERIGEHDLQPSNFARGMMLEHQ